VPALGRRRLVGHWLRLRLSGLRSWPDLRALQLQRLRDRQRRRQRASLAIVLTACENGGMWRRLWIVVLLAACGSSSSTPGDGGITSDGSNAGGHSFGDPHSGNFWLGPVDYTETQFHNACAPSNKYPAGIRQLYGNYIMGLANQVQLGGLTASQGQLCDVCAELTANGHTLVAHVVTYGQETGPNDIDVSPEIDTALGSATGRTLTWRFVSCPTTAPVRYTFDGRQWSNTYFFRVWVRNARVPVAKVEYRIGTAAWAAAAWQNDGAFQASSQDFSGGFQLRVTSIDGQILEDAIPGLGTFDPDVGIASHGNFQ
jgi:expansin (peptidoglycan-binding protein)